MTIKKVLLISRPRFWLYTLGPYIVGISAANTQQLLNPIIFYGLFYFLLPANLFIYGVNDYFDRALDPKNLKKHKQESYMRSREAPFYIFLVSVSVLLSLPLLMFGFKATVIALTFLFFGFFYSSPPLRFKTIPILDSLSNFFYILPGVLGYLLVTDSFPPLNIIIAASLWAVAMHLFSAIVDIKADANAGIKTSATVLGYQRSLLCAGFLWLVSIFCVLPYSQLLLVGFVYPLLPFYILVKKADINRVYWLFPWINSLLGFIIFCIVFYGQ